MFPSLLEALIEAIIGRDIDYTATFGLAIAAAVLLKQRMQPAPLATQSDRRMNDREECDHETQKTA